jgi:glutathione S-transferase
VEFPDVKATLHSIGAPPSSRKADGRPVYTLPVIVDPTRNPQIHHILSNANNIAECLEASYPARPIFPEGSRALQTFFVHHIQEVLAKPLLPIMVPISYDRLPERTQTHFHGMPTASHALLPGPQRECAWQLVKEQFDFLSVILDKNVGDGDGIVTHFPYPDFKLCSVLLWIEQMVPQDGWAPIMIRNRNGGRWVRLRQRCQDYMTVL